MRRKLSFTCLLLAWICANGALLDLVQVVAWGRMYLVYSGHLSPEQAFKKTFDPSKPCSLCLAVHKARDTAREQLPRDAAMGSAMDKILLLPDFSPEIVLNAPESRWPGLAGDSGLSRVEAVPVPPPRA